MEKLSKILFATGFALLLISCYPHTRTFEIRSKQEQLASRIKYLLNDPNLANAEIGLYIESLKDGEVIYHRNEYKLFIPASNQKLYTTATAFEKLGPDYRYRTDFLIRGDVNGGILNGDLIVRGSGDPSISGRFNDGDVLALFNSWADSLTAKGIKQINGNVIGDDSYFSDNKLGYGWNWDDESYWYSAQVAALSYNDNCIDLNIFPGAHVGDSVIVKTDPESDYVCIENTAKTVDKDSLNTLAIWRERAQNIILVSGSLPLGSNNISTSITIEDPATWFIDVFTSVLKNRSIAITGNVMAKSSPPKASDMEGVSLLFSHYSHPLTDLVRVVNKNSQNFYAEQIFKTLGAEIKKKGTARASAKVIKEFLASIGVDDDLAITYDGSGLSRMNLVSPFSTSTLLRYMYHSKNFQPFYDSLPIAGVDGTLKGRMKGTAAEGVLHAKTGFVTHVRSLSGYTKDKSGNDYLFCIMVNHYSVPTPYINNLQDKICVLLTNYSPDKN